MMLPKFTLPALLAASAIASPLTLQKRAPIMPEIKGYTDQHITQIKDGFSDAYHLAMNALGAPDHQFDKIFKKYFSTDDKKTVKEVLTKIVGSYPTQNPGSSMIKNIQIVKDYKDDDGEFACDGYTMAEIRKYESDKPEIIICEHAGLGHGGIRKGYSGVHAVDCDYLENKVSWKMETMGSIILHELTHWKKLVSPPLKKETDDDDDYYGPKGSRDLPNKAEATNIADQYSWFATELLWTMSCGKDYADPDKNSDEDPHCDGKACTATKAGNP